MPPRPSPEVSRRDLLQGIGAGVALAGAAGCDRGPPEHIVPYARQPPEITPSIPTMYATTMSLDGYAVGLIAETHEGRPTKVEGNPAHPANLGALGAVHQASVLDLYDPTRATQVLHDGSPATWRDLLATVAARPPAGKRVHVLLEPTSSPHLVSVIRRVASRGDVAFHFHSPVSRDNAWHGAELAFGRVVDARCHFAKADVVLALDADFLGSAGATLAWQRAWAERRRPAGTDGAMSRLYAVEPRLTVTGMAADERLRVQAREVVGVAADLAAQLVTVGSQSVPRDVRDAAAARRPGRHREWARAVARDLQAHAGAALVVAGDGQPRELYALVAAMNDLLGNVGRTVTYGPSPVHEAGASSHGLAALVRAIDAGEVAALLIVGGDPAYSAPADLELSRRVRNLPTTVFVGARENHTAGVCSWFGPEAHVFESWGDGRAFDGTASIAQPLLAPLVDGRTAGEVLSAMTSDGAKGSRELVEAHWRAQAPSGDFTTFWRRALARGVVADSAAPDADVHLDWAIVARLLGEPPTPPAPLEIVFFADTKVYGGRFADNRSLQELPDPVTKLTWDNAALVGPSTAARRGLASEDVVELTVRGRTLRAPVLVCPAMADDVVAIAVGYGQTVPHRVSSGVGVDAYHLRDSRAPWCDDADLRKASGSWPLALTQEQLAMQGRPIALERTRDEYRRDPEFAKPNNTTGPFLYQLKPEGAHQWGMTIDLNACTGCSACVVACVAENNIPAVGKGGVRLGRQMHWLRIDRYFVGDPDGGSAIVQPMLCQHCEKAPCEYVCPVNATVHSPDGLNEMVYNRCVGTRFCSNNCPYKVRRFNFFNYNSDKPETLQLAMNPDVTVRARGVMEKCTYCVQRIREAEISARRELRPLRDGDVVTACQQTCPTAAITFGDIADPTSRVSASRDSDRLYAVLHELGTLPRTRYLARITNPNPEMHRS